jgi:alkanesulfonate monooxygenase SsuD/methylene tetrahydromethanopterin reductase-like flavin-dependent oxidoreductase (luciferase family)
MQVGIQLGFMNLTGMPDHEFYRRETQLAIEAEAMGFDFVAPVEHHFTDYAADPDPIQLLCYIAAKTKTLKLMPGAVILPWNDPLRVVEKMSVLDALSEGRAILGMGRGAARREFKSFRVELADSREMFDEAALIIMEGLETGIVEADTKWYKIPRTEVRPRPSKSFKDRSVMVSMSPGSVEVAAKYGLKSLRFSQGDWERALPEINSYRDTFKEVNGREAPPFIICDFMCCFDTQAEVNEYVDKYFSQLFAQVANHYEIFSEHFKALPSYATWATLGQLALERGGADKAYKDYVDANLIGTPETLWEMHIERTRLVGDYEIVANFSYGGMPYELVYDQMRRFADKILPKLKAGQTKVDVANGTKALNAAE